MYGVASPYVRLVTERPLELRFEGPFGVLGCCAAMRGGHGMVFDNRILVEMACPPNTPINQRGGSSEVEHLLAMQGVASSILVLRSTLGQVAKRLKAGRS